MWVARPKYDILSQKTLSGHYLKERIAPDDHKWLCNSKLYTLKKDSSPYTCKPHTFNVLFAITSFLTCSGVGPLH
jgi:hypothetical protein